MNEKTLKGIVFTNKITIFAASFNYIGFIASYSMALWPHEQGPMALSENNYYKKFKP